MNTEKLFPPNDQALWDMHMKALLYPVLLAADELGLFSALATAPLSAAALGNTIRVGKRFTDICVGLFQTNDFFISENGNISLTEISRTYLLPESKFYWGGMFQLGRANYPIYQEIVEAAKSDFVSDHSTDHAFVSGWVKGELQPEVVERFTAAMQSQSLASATAAASKGLYQSFTRLLDVGAGSGCFSIAAAESNLNLKCTIFDFPQVCEVAQRYARLANLQSQIISYPGNFFTDAWPKDFDCILFSHIFHDWSESTIESLLLKAKDSLMPDGVVMINEHLLSEDRTGPVDTLCFSATMLIRTRGKQFTLSDLKVILERVGLSVDSVHPTLGPASILLCKLIGKHHG